MNYLRLTPFLLLAPALGTASERDDALKLSDVVITANRQVEDRAQTSAAVSVFTRDDIDRLQPTNLNDLLRRVPGVQIAPTGGRGSVPGIFIRGTKTAQSLVLVDGVRIANATSGDSGLQFLNVDQIERVEVLRGSRSALYGSDAIGGVIQIFTRRGGEQGLQPRLHLSGGSQQTWQRSLGLAGGNQATRFNLGASLDESAGSDDTRTSFGSDRDHDAYRAKAVNLSLSHRFDDTFEAGLNLLDSHGRSEYDNPYGSLASGAPQRPYTDFTVSSLGTYLAAQFTEHWHSRLDLGHSENRDKKYDKLSSERSAFTTYRDSLTWQNDLSLGARNSLILGGDWFEDRVHTNEQFVEDSRWNRAAFVQHRFKGDGFTTELGLRRDQNQQFGGQNSWSASLSLPLNADNEVLWSYSEGFRAPTFNDLYYPYYGNPDLQPERSKSYEVQWRSDLSSSTRLETSLYRTELRDAIVSGADFRQHNIAAARINGFEATLQQELFGWQGNLGLAIIDPRDKASGHTLARRARRTLSLDLDRQFDQLGLGASWQAVSSSYDDDANRRTIGGYGLVGLRSSWKVSTELTLEAKLDNLFDQNASRALYLYDTQYYGYRDSGRTWLFGVTWTPAL